MKEWIDYYDSDHAFYVSARHRDAHFRHLADQFIASLPSREARVLDYSCGEALDAARIASHCAELILAEPAPNVRARLKARFGDVANIRIIALDDLPACEAHSVDFVMMNSVAQYMKPADLDAALAEIHRLIAPGGRLLLGDILAPRVSALHDAAALVEFGWREGFARDALRGIVHMGLSDYRKLRTNLGLTRYDEATILAKLGRAGFAARRLNRNIGHNRSRMSFLATPVRTER